MTEQKCVDENNNTVDNKLCHNINCSEIYKKDCKKIQNSLPEETLKRYSRKDMYILKEKVDRNSNSIYIVDYPKIQKVTFEVTKSNDANCSK